MPSVLLLQNYAHILHRKADSSTDVEFKEEQRLQLDRTLHSLINLSLHEGRVRRMTICAQTAISYSALMILHSPSFLESDISVQPITMEMRINLEKRKAPVSWSTTLDSPGPCHTFIQIVVLPLHSCLYLSFHLVLYLVLISLHRSCSEPVKSTILLETRANSGKEDKTLEILRPAAEATSLKSRAFLTPPTGPRSTSQTSPLLLHWAYLAASIYLQIIWSSGVDGQLGPLEVLKTKLKVMSERWLVAGMQLSLLSLLTFAQVNTAHLHLIIIVVLILHAESL